MRYSPPFNPAQTVNPRAPHAGVNTSTGNPRSADPQLQPQPYSPQRYPGGSSGFTGGMSWDDVNLQLSPQFAGGPAAGVQPLPGDWSLQNPGAAEDFFSQAQGQFLNPTWGETFATGMVPQIAQPGAGQQYWESFGSGLAGNATAGGSMSAQAYRDFASRRPDLMSDPGLGAHYDNAKRRALESVGQQSAAAGGYGSSVAQDVGAEAITNLEAERANREADYALRRAAEDRMYGTASMMGASQADQNQLGWATGLGRLALGAEEAGLARELGAVAAARGLGQDEVSRLMGGMNAAIGAQNAREGRIGGAFDDIFGMGTAAGGAAGGTYNSMFDDVFSIEDAIMQYLTGSRSAAVRESESDTAQNAQGLRDAVNIAQGMGWIGGGVQPAVARPPAVQDFNFGGSWS